MTQPEQDARRPDGPDPVRGRLRDFWQLDVPLVVVLTLCTAITIIEYTRATDGVWRAWIYLFEWPMIGAFAVWMWYRFKHEKGGGFVRRWKERVARLEAESDDRGADNRGADSSSPAPDDPQLHAWRAYQRQLRQGQPPTPPV